MLKSALENKKYFATVLVLSAILLGVFTTVLYQQYKLSQEINQLVVHSYEVLRRGRLVLSHVLDVETGQRGYLLTGSKKFLEPYNIASGKLDTAMETVINLVADNPEQEIRAIALREKVEEFKSHLSRQMIKFGVQGSAGIRAADLQASRRAMEDLRSLHQSFMRAEMTLLNDRSAAANKKQKHYIYTLVAGSALAFGGMAIGNVLVLFFIGRYRRTREELRAVEERYALVMNGVNDGLFDYNLMSGDIYYSPSYKAMLGYSEKEFPNKVESFYAILHPEDAEAVKVAIERFKSGKQVQYSHVYRLRHKNGSWRWIMARGVGLWNKKKELERLIGTHTDITEQKEREQELKQVNADLESFTYLASHDLRAPLVNLKGFAGEIEYTHRDIKPLIDKAAKTLPENEQERLQEAFTKDIPESLKFLRTAVERMDTLTKAILELCRIGAKVYNFEHIDANKLVDTCLQTLAHDLSKQRVEVVRESLPDLYTDRLSLEQVFTNILDNSIKYLDPSRPGKIHISAQEFPKAVFICVRDNGRGIAKEDQDAVFNVFRRAVNTSGVRGAGLGMPYVQAILRKLGGRIWFESILGKGTAFYFSIPKASAEEEPVAHKYKEVA